MSASIAEPAAIVFGLSPTGLYAVRELGRAGIEVIGVASGLQAARSSRYLSDYIEDSGPAGLLAQLCKLFPSNLPNKPVLLPTSDHYVDFIINHAEQLSLHFVFQPSYSDGLAERIMTKESFYEVCNAEGIEHPKLISANPEDIAGLRDQISYPCMIKPSRIHDVKDRMQGRKGWIVRSVDEFDSLVPTLPSKLGVLLLQEIVPGPESEITLCCGYFDRNSKLRQSFTARKLRQYPPGFGSASMVQSAKEEDSLAITERLLSAIGYEGIAAAEFKRDPVSNQLKIIEINVRPSLWFAVSSASGKTVVLAAYRDLAGIQTPTPDISQINGIRWRYVLKDLWSSVFYRLNRSFLLPPPDIGVVGRPRERVSAVYSRDDFWPTLTELINYASKLARSLRDKVLAR